MCAECWHQYLNAVGVCLGTLPGHWLIGPAVFYSVVVLQWQLNSQYVSVPFVYVLLYSDASLGFN